MLEAHFLRAGHYSPSWGLEGRDTSPCPAFPGSTQTVTVNRALEYEQEFSKNGVGGEGLSQ